MVQAKRKAKAKTQALVRGEPVVRGVLAATLREAARAGYHGLRIEDVAALAGVNKTTVYRRWPSKQELVRDALMSIASETFAVAGTGSLRGDMLAIARRIGELAAHPQFRGLFRLFVVEGDDPDMMAIVKSVRAILETGPRAILEAAEARGEIAPGVDPKLLFDVFGAAINRRLFLERAQLDDEYLQRLIDLLLHGALAPGQRTKPRGRTRAAE
ncbi:TetR/AcrR family transcriptional regulator [Nannocystis radixulma]|uniref:TetR/AcrR family transcriptional regulator n=1 Tax=Nannocystis radixulma TaxID=2995305 RepID=A0ABT5AXC8_9BACT|nr:TetR/AcrR family transcriptional regulator [Nannocystis radixulma]MDC0666115.1 TetR/AcrR family transcriptional regulator [Nannocystis radixulma]